MTFPELRYYLYEVIYDIANKNSAVPLTEVQNLTILFICNLLKRGSFILSDDEKVLKLTLSAFTHRIETLDANVLVKISTLAQSRPELQEVQILNKSMLQRVCRDPSILTIGDLTGFLNKMIYQDLDCPLYPIAVDYLCQLKDDGNMNIIDVKCLIQSINNLSLVNHYNEDFVCKLFSVVNEVSPELFESKDQHQDLAKEICLSIFKEFFPKSFQNENENGNLQNDIAKSLSVPRDWSRITRSIATLDVNIGIDLPSFPKDKRLKTEFSDYLLRINQSPIPIEVYSAQMSLDGLPKK